MRPRSAHLARALYNATIAGRHRIDAVARVVGVATSTAYDWAEGRRTLPAYAIPGVFRATQDLELYSALCGAPDLGLVVTERGAGDVVIRDSRGAALDVGAEAGRVLGLVSDVEADGVVTAQELARVEAELDRLQRRAETLRAQMRSRASRR